MLGKSKKKKEASGQAQKKEQSSLALQIVNRYLRWVLFLVVCIMLFIGYTFILQQQISEAQSAAKESLPLKQEVLDDLKTIETKLDQASSDYDRILREKKPALDRIALLLPRHSEYGELFPLLNKITQASGFTLQSMNLTLPADADAPPASTSDTSVSDPITSGLVHAINIRLSVQGGDYEGIKNYLKNLERNVRLFDISSVTVSGSVFIQQNNGVTTTPAYDLELKTYYQP